MRCAACAALQVVVRVAVEGEGVGALTVDCAVLSSASRCLLPLLLRSQSSDGLLVACALRRRVDAARCLHIPAIALKVHAKRRADARFIIHNQH